MRLKTAMLWAGVSCLLVGVAPAQRNARWVASWTSSQQIPEPQNALTVDELTDATIRQIVHLSLGGSAFRIHLSNAFGMSALRVSSVHIARPESLSSSAIDVATDREVTFGGNAQVTIPAGAEYVSDEISFRADALSSVAISIHLDEAPAQQTGHPGSRATSYLVHGDRVKASVFREPKTFDHWMMLSGVDVQGTAKSLALVALGDSITDGHGAGVNANERWTDYLSRRLQEGKKTRDIAVVNEGIGGNHLLTDGLGPNALARFDRDVLAPAGVRYVLVLEGVNDLGGLARDGGATPQEHRELVEAMEGAYSQIIARGHAHGLKVIGGTITPFVGSDYYHPDAASEGDRQRVNEWIRVPGHFDAVVDFDKLIAVPLHREKLAREFDSGDHLHPSPNGYEAMADGISLALFTQ
jgi:lysophospholipase L1-like esterase